MFPLVFIQASVLMKISDCLLLLDFFLIPNLLIKFFLSLCLFEQKSVNFYIYIVIPLSMVMQ